MLVPVALIKLCYCSHCLFLLLFQFFSKTTERFVHGVDSFIDTLWKVWSDLLDVMGIDCKFKIYYDFAIKIKRYQKNDVLNKDMEFIIIKNVVCFVKFFSLFPL